MRRLEVRPLTPGRWADLQALFGAPGCGVARRCWCMYYRRSGGVARALLAGAIAYARKRGARLLEAYPVDRPARSRDDAMWFGAKSMYDRAGFVEVVRRKRDRPVMRRRVR